MAKRKPGEQSLFDNLEIGEESAARGGGGAALRASAPSGDGNGAGTISAVVFMKRLSRAISTTHSRSSLPARCQTSATALKPVQRRILYTMWQQNPTADVKHRKCAKVRRRRDGQLPSTRRRGSHETLVRMAQPFSLRYPLVDGSGNFGSLDGDSAAAMRHTECRLAGISNEMLTEIEQTTVPFRPELRRHEDRAGGPARRESRTCSVNGTTGTAVGMATNIPPLQF